MCLKFVSLVFFLEGNLERENQLVENSPFTVTHESMKSVFVLLKVKNNGSQGAGLFRICI